MLLLKSWRRVICSRRCGRLNPWAPLRRHFGGGSHDPGDGNFKVVTAGFFTKPLNGGRWFSSRNENLVSPYCWYTHDDEMVQVSHGGGVWIK